MISHNRKFYLLVFISLAIPVPGCSEPSRDRDSPAPSVVPADSSLAPGRIVTEVRPDADHVYRQTAFYPDGVTPRLVKHCFVNDRGHYLSTVGNYVVYEYLRPDGTLEKEKMVKPFPMLDSSVVCKYRIRHYAVDGKTEVRSEVYRVDDTLASVSDYVTHTHTQYRLDGVTLRQIHSYDGRNDKVVYFRKDGTTRWWEFEYGTNRGVVHFDGEGKAINRQFIRKDLSGLFSLGYYDDLPKETYQYSYLREDGTVEYCQTWCRAYDKKTDDFFDALLRVDVFAADGKTKARIYLEPRRHTGQLFIKTSLTVDDGGTMLGRVYSAPRVRDREILSDAAGAVVERTSFAPTDDFEEPVDPIWLQGFGPGLNLYGYDSDFNDK